MIDNFEMIIRMEKIPILKINEKNNCDNIKLINNVINFEDS